MTCFTLEAKGDASMPCLPDGGTPGPGPDDSPPPDEKPPPDPPPPDDKSASGQ